MKAIKYLGLFSLCIATTACTGNEVGDILKAGQQPVIQQQIDATSGTCADKGFTNTSKNWPNSAEGTHHRVSSKQTSCESYVIKNGNYEKVGEYVP